MLPQSPACKGAYDQRYAGDLRNQDPNQTKEIFPYCLPVTRRQINQRRQEGLLTASHESWLSLVVIELQSNIPSWILIWLPVANVFEWQHIIFALSSRTELSVKHILKPQAGKRKHKLIFNLLNCMSHQLQRKNNARNTAGSCCWNHVTSICQTKPNTNWIIILFNCLHNCN